MIASQVGDMFYNISWILDIISSIFLIYNIVHFFNVSLSSQSLNLHVPQELQIYRNCNILNGNFVINILLAERNNFGFLLYLLCVWDG